MARAPRLKNRAMVALSRGDMAECVANGSVLVIDPGSGASSLPGYAVFFRGHRVESGVIEVGPPSRPLRERLAELNRTLREDLGPPPNPDAPDADWDCVIIEDIPTKRYGSKSGKGGRELKTASMAGQVTLHRAVGAILAGVRTKHELYIHPSTWHAHVGPDYQKSDEGDSIAMGEVAIRMARSIIQARLQRRGAPNCRKPAKKKPKPPAPPFPKKKAQPEGAA